MTRKKKCPESLEPPSSEGVPVARKKLCAEERTVNSMESEKKDKLKHNIKTINLLVPAVHQLWVGNKEYKLMCKKLKLGEGEKKQFRTHVPEFQPCRPVLADLIVQLLGKNTERGNALSGGVVIVFEDAVISRILNVKLYTHLTRNKTNSYV